MNARLRQRVIDLRLKEQLSYTEIRRRLGVPKSTLSYWLGEYPLREEQIRERQRQGWKNAEAGRERFRATMRRKRQERFETIYQQQRRRLRGLSPQSFFVAGLMLYVAEGDKRNQTRIALANTDPAVIKFFVHWLDVCFGVDKKAIRFQLHLYENMEVAREVAFWRKSLGVAAEQIYRPSIRKLRPASFTYPESSRHGTCSLFVLSTNKKAEMLAAVKVLFEAIGKI